MSADALVTFEDILNAIIRRVKIQATDGETIQRIKQDINIIYINEVVPFKPRAWHWLQKFQNVTTTERIIDGEVTVTKNSTTITFSEAPAISVADYYIKLAGYPEVIKITAHTAASTTATLEDAWPLATTSDSGYQMWKDSVSLNSDCKEVIQVTHSRKQTPMDAVNPAKFWEMRQRNPETQGWPSLYSSQDYDASGNVVLKWFPANYDNQVLLKVMYAKEVEKLDLDDDEPLMPIEDRIVLFYGALSMAWERERNESESAKAWNLFQTKLAHMAGKAGNAPQVTEMTTDPDYLTRTRYRRFSGRSRSRKWEQD